MLKTDSFYRFILPCLVALLASCAQIVAPSGGAKDQTVPKVVKEEPANKNIQFSDHKITIKFDEFIQLKDMEEQLVISPPLDEKPIIEVQGKNVVIQLMGKLKPNTTYTFNFGNSIVDNHEGNAISNYSYVFATGPFIDTLKVKGTIQNAFTAKPEKGVLVCLYPVEGFTDSTIVKQKPFYFTKTNESGSFSIHNLPPEAFKLVAFKDENKNIKYDQNEPIAFADSTINTTDSMPHNQLLLFKPNPYPVNKLLDTIVKNTGVFRFVVFNPYQVVIEPLNVTPYYTWVKPGKDNLDTISLFSNSFKSDSVWFRYKAFPYDTTFFVRPSKTAKTLKFESSIQKTLELNDTFIIQFNLPLSKAVTDTSKLILTEDTTIVTPKVFYSQKGDYLKLYYPLKEQTSYKLSYKDSVFTDIYGGFNKREKVSYKTKTPKDYSNLILNINYPGDGMQYIVQMVTEDETKVFKTFIINQNEKINLEYLLPAKYKLKVIRDINRNGIWDNGNYRNHTQPEKVFYYAEILTLRAYWDLEQTIDLNKIVD